MKNKIKGWWSNPEKKYAYSKTCTYLAGRDSTNYWLQVGKYSFCEGSLHMYDWQGAPTITTI